MCQLQFNGLIFLTRLITVSQPNKSGYGLGYGRTGLVMDLGGPVPSQPEPFNISTKTNN